MTYTAIGKNHPIFKDLRNNIKRPKEGQIFAEDLNTLEIAIKLNLRIKQFFYCDDIQYHDETKEIINKAFNISDEIYTISNSNFSLLAQKENSIGFIFQITLPNYTIEEFKNKNFLLIANSLEIPGNLGTIYRTLDSVNCDGIILVDPITKSNNPKLTQASRGSNIIIPNIEMSYTEAQRFLVENNFSIYLGEPNLGLDYQSYNYSGKIALVIGNERFGINPNWYNNPHYKVYIPMEGNNNSLNVGVAASILIYEAYMKRRKKIT